MTRMGLVTFLANDCVDSVARTSRLSKYALPGGGDYHWAVKKGAEEIFVNEASYDEAVSEVMGNMTKSTQRLHSQAALKSLYEWKLSHPGTYVPAPSGNFVGPKGELIIRLDPSFACVSGGKSTAYVLWLFKELRLTPQVAGMGVHLLQSALGVGEHSNWRFALLDVPAGKVFSRTHKNTASAVEFAVRTQEELLLSVKKAA